MSIDDWTKIDLGPSATQLHTAITYGNGKFVLVGAQTIKRSTDNGVSWDNPVSGITATLHGVAYGSGLFVAVGNFNGTSTDGISWPPPFTQYTDPSGSTHTLRAVAYGIVSGAGLFVAVGDGRTIVTWNGTNWVVPPMLAIPPPPAVPSGVDFTAITFGNGTFVVAGSNSTILTSPDGSSWTKPTFVPPNTELRGAAYGSAGFVGVTSGTAMTALLTSPDGSSWASKGGPAGGLRGIGYGRQTFVVVGDMGRIYRSPDQGGTWTNSNTTVSGLPTLNAVAYGNDGFVAVGNGGTILQSEFASLSALTCSAGPLTPAFSPGRTVYDVTALGGSATVTPTDPMATMIEVRSNSIGRPPAGPYSPVASGTASAAAPVAWRLTTFEIKVTASNGATKTYTVGVHRKFPVLLRWLSWFGIR